MSRIDDSAAASPKHEGPINGPWQRAGRRFLRNRLAVVSLGILVLLHLATILAPWLSNHSPEAINLLKRFAPPSADHWLGTDEMGRDMFSRLLYGGRVSLGIGLAAMAGGIAIGALLGGMAGFWGRWVDTVLMRITDAMLSFPVFFFLLTVLALFGSSTFNIITVIALTSWMPVARIVRSEVLRVRQLQFVEAARALGNRNWRIFFVHVLPHCYPSIIVAATLGVAGSILTESALSYLGLGINPPQPSWGNMLNGARSYIWSAPHLVLYPGILIFITVLAYNAVGDGLRDAVDPASSKE